MPQWAVWGVAHPLSVIQTPRVASDPPSPPLPERRGSYSMGVRGITFGPRVAGGDSGRAGAGMAGAGFGGEGRLGAELVELGTGRLSLACRPSSASWR